MSINHCVYEFLYKLLKNLGFLGQIRFFCILYTTNLKREADFSASLLTFRRNYFSLRLFIADKAIPKIANPSPAIELLSTPVLGSFSTLAFLELLFEVTIS